MTCASPFTTYSTLLFLELFQAGLNLDQIGLWMGLLRVVVFGDADDNVHHIRHAAAAFGAAIELVIDLGRDYQLPGIGAQQIEDDILNLLGRDHVALANEHLWVPDWTMGLMAA
jgi:predicted metal-dependent hydrolase